MMTFWFTRVVFAVVLLLCVTADWPVPKSIKCNSSGTFHCKNTGTYEDPFDFTCTKYFLCNEFKHEIVEVELTCPENTFFDPVNEYCSSEYKCICKEGTTTYEPNIESSTLRTETPLPYPDECQICLQCITSHSSKSPTTSNTIWTTNPSKSTFYTTLTEDTSITKESPDPTTANVEETTFFSNNSWTTWLPKTTYPEHENFSSDFTTNISKTFLSTLTSPVSGEAVTAATPSNCFSNEEFVCTETGRFANSNDPTCNSYFYCYVSSNSSVGQYLYSCSIGFFNPIKGACDTSYVCPCSKATATETDTISTISQHPPWSSTELTTIFPTNAKYCGGNFTCTQTGRFANPDDVSCNSYFYCYVWSNGTVNQHLYSCSIGLFNPSKGICDLLFSCPCLESAATDTTPIFSISQHPQSSSSQSISSTQTLSTTEFVLTFPTSKYCNIGGDFTCTETGRFANPNDPSCNSYFYCYVSSNGNVGQYLYSCSIGLFNPTKGACDLSYLCPCSETTAAETASSLTTTQQSQLTSSQPSLSTHTVLTTEPETVSSTTLHYCNLGGNFSCTETGYFANTDDPSCHLYFYCSFWSNGNVNQFSYTCSVGLFNPSKGACDLSYVCPCSESTAAETASSFITTQQTQLSSSHSSLSTQTVLTTEPATVSSIGVHYCNVGGNFSCTETGRFANPDDPSCNSYFYCYVWSHGNVNQYLYTCSVGLFNPSKGACDLSFVCPCSKSTAAETASNFITTQQTQLSSSHSSLSTQTVLTTEPATVSSIGVQYCNVGGNFSCTETGRFANPDDPSCNSYFYCYVWSNGNVGQYFYTCSVGLFNPSKGACDLSYVCPCSESTTTETTPVFTTTQQLSSLTSEQTISTTEFATASTTPMYCNVGGNFNCTKTGRFVNPDDPSCKSYFYCYNDVWIYNNKINQYLYSCSIGLFNPSKGACDLSYVCPCSESTTTETTPVFTTTQQLSSLTSEQTISTTEFATASTTSMYCNVGGNFNCTKTGRFANPDDPSCKSYFYCYDDVWYNSKINQYLYSCSVGLFNPSKGACDLSYVCPCSESTTTETTPVFTNTQQLSSLTSEQTISTTEFAIASTTPMYCNVGGNFNCTKTGRFVNPDDPSCKSYFYCYDDVWYNNKINQYLYSCSIGLFNPSKGACDLSYICPCSESTTTETTPVFTTTQQLSSLTSEQTISTTEFAIASTTPMYCNVGGNFNCTKTGRFVNPDDPSCKSYFYCYNDVWIYNNKINQYLYSCSIGLFNPSKGACDLSYVCPCSKSTTTETTPVFTTTQQLPPLTSEQTISTTEFAIASTTPMYCNVGGNFNCTKTGRFANPDDPSCKSYFYCYVWSNSKINQYLYSCSIGLFNPSKGACDRAYDCPCSPTNTNSTISSSKISSFKSPGNVKSNTLLNKGIFWLPWSLYSPTKNKTITL